MRMLLVVVLHELGQHGPKMPLVEHDEMVETLSAQGPDRSLRDGIGLWRVDRRGDCIDADTPSAVPKIAAIDGVAIAEQMAWFPAPGRSLDDLTPQPGCRRLAVTLTCTSSRRPWPMNTNT